LHLWCSRANIEGEITDADAAELLLTSEQHSRRVIERLGMNDYFVECIIKKLGS
jgi:hypothetical protein